MTKAASYLAEMNRHAHATALRVAGLMLIAIRPSCERAEIAGSIRRGAETVKDIEIVCVPTPVLDLFGQPTGDDLLRPAIDAMIARGSLAWRTNASDKPGRKFYPLVAVKSGIPIDLFAVMSPAQWGAIMAIRTGPAEYAKHLVTVCQRRGLRCMEGRLVRSDGSTVETPEERDFIRECGASWAEPEARR